MLNLPIASKYIAMHFTSVIQLSSYVPKFTLS